jgi:hypothetical protein
MVSQVWKYTTYVVVVLAAISISANLVLLHLTSGGAVAVMECRATLSQERKECKDYLIKQQAKMDKVTTNQSSMADALFQLIKDGKSIEEMRKFNQFAEQTGAMPKGVGGASSSD